MSNSIDQGIRSLRVGVLWNVVLATVKLIAGVLGHTYALVADAVESAADVFTSLVVWRGLHVASREPDEAFPFGYGKAEPLAAGVVALVLLGASFGIAFQAIREVRVPHQTPAPWTLVVLIGVIAVKWILSRRMESVGAGIGSMAVRAESWHHLSDAITSAAAFIGISIALLGARYFEGSHWASADDWAALAASLVIAVNGAAMLRAASLELMDKAPDADAVNMIRGVAEAVPGVRATEKLAVRKAGLSYRVTLHVQADSNLSLRDSHILSGMVKTAIRAADPRVASVLVHMEPFEQKSADSVDRRIEDRSGR